MGKKVSKNAVKKSENEGHHHQTLERQLLTQVSAAGLRMTTARRMMIRILVEEHGPFTMESLHARVANTTNTKVDLVTVYRTMTRFEHMGLVTRCDFGDGFLRYELAHQSHHHHHIICRICQKVQPLPNCAVDQSLFLPDGHGYRDISHRLEFFGVCSKCVDT